MSDYPVASRKSDYLSVPRAFQATGPEGQIVVLSVTTTPYAVDLTKGFSQAAYTGLQGPTSPSSPSNNYLSIVSDVDVGVIFGKTVALVTAGNAPSLTAVGGLSGNTYTGAAGTCYVIKANAPPTRFLLQVSLDNFIGMVGSGAGIVRMYQSSPSNA